MTSTFITRLAAGIGLSSLFLLTGCGGGATATPSLWEKSIYHSTANPTHLLAQLNTDQASYFSITDGLAAVVNYDTAGNLTDEITFTSDLGSAKGLTETNEGILWYGLEGMIMFDNTWNVAWEYPINNTTDTQFNTLYVDDGSQQITYATKTPTGFEFKVIAKGQLIKSYTHPDETIREVRHMAVSGDTTYAYLTPPGSWQSGRLLIFDGDFNLVNSIANTSITRMVTTPTGIAYVGYSGGIVARDRQGELEWIANDLPDHMHPSIASTSDALYFMATKPADWSDRADGTMKVGPKLVKYNFSGEKQWSYYPSITASNTGIIYNTEYDADDYKLKQLPSGNLLLTYKETTNKAILLDTRFTKAIRHHLISKAGRKIRSITEKTVISDRNFCPDVVLCPGGIGSTETIKHGHRQNYGAIVSSNNKIITLSTQGSGIENVYLSELTAY